MPDPQDPSTPPREPSDLDGLDGLNAAALLARAMNTVKPSGDLHNWTPPEPEELRHLLPQYEIQQLIGRGGMGAVYKAVQLSLNRPVAIKLLPVEVAADENFVARFEREARTLARLQHPRIIMIYEFGRTAAGHLFFVMEYVDGTNMREIIRGAQLTAEQALAVVEQLCDALQAAHREGVVHRDIKPENVMITSDGYVKLADFGLARPPQEPEHSVLTKTNLVMGTADYMAPEQWAGAANADHRSDIFALGVMFYEMLTGTTPRGIFQMPSKKVRVDVRIDEVVLKALQAEPDRRYQKASEMKSDVETIRSTPPDMTAPAKAAPAGAPASGGGSREWRKHWPILAALGAAALVSAGLLALPLMRTKQNEVAPAAEPGDRTARANTSPPSTPVVATPVPVPEVVVASATPAAPPATPRATPQASAAAVPTPTPAAVARSTTPAPTPVPAITPPLSPVASGPPGPAAVAEIESRLMSHYWSLGAWVLTFLPNHEMMVQEQNPPLRTWHWWVTGNRTVHIQFAADPAVMDPKIGGDATFDANFTKFDMWNNRRKSWSQGQRLGPIVLTKVAQTSTPSASAPPVVPAPAPPPTETPAKILYSTGFEAPTYRVGKFHNGNGLEVGDGHWNIFADGTGSDIDRAVMVKSMAYGGGSQVLEFIADPANKTPTGMSTLVENHSKVVVIRSDVMIQSSSRPTGWQWGAGDNKTEEQSEGFVAGFTIDNRDAIRLKTRGSMNIFARFRRDVWTHIEMRVDFEAQTYDLKFDGKDIASRVPFERRAKTTRIFQFNTFANGSDRAYFDNFAYIEAKP